MTEHTGDAPDRPLASLPFAILIDALRSLILYGDVTGDAHEHCLLALDELEFRDAQLKHWTLSQ